MSRARPNVDHQRRGAGLKESRIIDVLLVSGFLGAGKTTLIKHLLTNETRDIGTVAVIVNELGEVGIDGTLLSGRDVDIIELVSGCICCTIKTDFFMAIQEIHDRVDPDFLVVEATGVAQPGYILDTLIDYHVNQFTRLRGLVTVVDADFFNARELLGPFYDNQIRFADVLILNKADQVGQAPLAEIEALLREMNPGAIILPAQFCNVDPSVLFQRYSKGQKGYIHDHDRHYDHEELGFQTFSFEDTRPVDREKLVDFLESLPPNLFRLKGWVRFHDASAFLDFTGGRYRIEPADSSSTTALTFVGRNCDETKILRDLSQCLIKESTDH